MKTDDLGGDLMRGVARVMVRRHLSDLVGVVGTEDHLIEAFLTYAQHHSSVSMRDAADGFRVALAQWQTSRSGA